MLARLWVPHLHLGHLLAQRNATAWLLCDVVPDVDWQLDGVRICLQKFRVLLLLSHVLVLVDVLSVDEVLLLTGSLHPVQVAHLLHGKVMWLELVRLLIVNNKVISFVVAVVLRERFSLELLCFSLECVFSAEGWFCVVGLAIKFKAGLDCFVVATDCGDGLLNLWLAVVVGEVESVL